MKPAAITDENFGMAMSCLTDAYFTLSLFDWAALVEQRKRADGFMHITDPTNYKKLIDSKNAADNMKAAEFARDFVREVGALAVSEGQ